MEISQYFSLFKTLLGDSFNNDIFKSFISNETTKDIVDTVFMKPTISRTEIIEFIKNNDNVTEETLVEHFGNSILLDIEKIGLSRILASL